MNSVKILFLPIKFWQLVIIILVLGNFISCSSDNSARFESNVKLKDYKTIVSAADTTVAVPSVIRYDGNSNLFVFDKKKGIVLELNSSGNIINKYGRKGRGPGEFLGVNNIFLTENNLYVVDNRQFVIHQFEKGGDLVSTMNYSRIIGSPNIPPSPFSSSSIYAENINNQPFVTQKGNVLLSTVGFSGEIDAVFELRNWEGDYLADIGEIPKGTSFVLDYNKLNVDIKNREVPSFYKSNAFPVDDHSNQREYFLIYNALPKIAKYNENGQKLWEKNIPMPPENDSIKTHFYDYMDQAKDKERLILKYYVSGTSDKQGTLFLVADSNNPLWIHQFSGKGKLVQRYMIVTEEVDLVPIFDIDIREKRVFVVTKEGEIRAYRF